MKFCWIEWKWMKIYYNSNCKRSLGNNILPHMHTGNPSITTNFVEQLLILWEASKILCIWLRWWSKYKIELSLGASISK